MGQGTNNGKITTIVNIPKQTPGLVQRDGFGSSELMQMDEVSTRAAAEQGRAMVEARYVMAMQNRRDIEQVRVRLLDDCKRRRFAAVARYAKPIGGGKNAEGWSVRFSEAALRAYSNVYQEIVILQDSAVKRVRRIALTDLESNVTLLQDLVMEKKVERSRDEGRRVYDTRTNSYGKPVFIVEATEEEFATKEAGIISRVRRGLALQLIPGDILDECLEQVYETAEKADAEDPKAAMRKLIDAYQALGIGPSDLAKYLGHKIEQTVPAEMRDLRALYTALRDGETTWIDAINAKVGDDDGIEATRRKTETLNGRLPKLRAELEALWGESPTLFEKTVGRKFTDLDTAQDYIDAHAAIFDKKTIDVPAEQPKPEAAPAPVQETDEAPVEEAPNAQALNVELKAAIGRNKAKAMETWQAGHAGRTTGTLPAEDRIALLRKLKAIGGAS